MSIFTRIAEIVTDMRREVYMYDEEGLCPTTVAGWADELEAPLTAAEAARSTC